jgi:rRNA processing/ribosome biogenesis
MFGLILTHPTFSRDLNSLLPTFFQTLLNLSTQSALLSAVLTALHTLIPEHATTFRPSITRTQALTLSLIDGAYPKEVKTLAAKVYVDLHHSAQKGGNSDHWRASFLGAIAEIHTVLDRMFEGVEEGTLVW